MEWLHIFIAFGIFEVVSAVHNSSSVGSSYLVSVSRVVRPDSPITLSITVLTRSPVAVFSEIILGNTSVSRTHSNIKGGSTKMQVLPPIPEDEWSDLYPYELVVRGYIGDTLIFTNSTMLHSSPRSVTILVQTDKPGYKPGDAVKIRAVIIMPDGSPCDEELDIAVMDPQGNRIQHWLSMNTVLGTVAKEFQLSQNPPLGMWKIVATADEVTQDKPFFVNQYVVPRFEVLVKAPEVLYYEDHLTSSVTAQYLFEKPVVGNIHVVYVHHTVHGTQEYFEDVKLIDGTLDFSLDVADLYRNTQSDNYTDPSHSGLETGDYIDINVQVTELLTGNSYNGTKRISVVMSRYALEFQQYSSIIKPSLNFSGQLRLFTYNNQPLSPADVARSVSVTVRQQSAHPEITPGPASSPLPNRTLTSSYHSENISVKTWNLSVPADGIIPLHVQLSDNVSKLTIEAQYEDAVETLQLYTGYFSPSNSYMQLQNSSTPQIGKPLRLFVESNFPLTVFHYVVTAHGQVVASGTSGSSFFVLSPTVSWVPLASVLVYSIRPDGEVVNGALDVSFTPVLRNSVSLWWEKKRVEPSEEVSLSVAVVEPGSLVGILVVDKACQDSDRSNDITEEEVIEELTKYAYAKDGPVDGMMGMEDPYSIFMVKGVTVLTDARLCKHTEHHNPDILWREGEQIPAMEAEDEEEPYCSSKSWLWLYANMSVYTTTSYSLTVPDSMTSWVATAFVISKNRGLGLSDPVELEVFKDFFLSLNLPSYIIQGEVLLLEVSIFNRMDWDLEVVVILDESHMFELVSPQGDIPLAAAMHRARVWRKSDITVIFPIRAIELGYVPIAIRALAFHASDSIFHTILVKPEGMEQSFTKMLFMDFAPKKNTISKELDFLFPPDVVAGSQRAEVTAVGDILGPSINSLKSLMELPYGYGEQNVISFGSAAYLLQYLTRMEQVPWGSWITALDYMQQGYEHELSFQRVDGSFSAFGNTDSSGSTWLTAFMLKCFIQAQSFINIDEEVLNSAASWLMAQQTPSGAFQEPGRVIHPQLHDALNGPVSITAYVLIALLEDREYMNTSLDHIFAAVNYLTSKLLNQDISSNYSLCLVAYALTLAESPSANTALALLMRRARMHDGVPMWSSHDVNQAASWQPSSADIEMASYVLLTLYRQGRPEQGYELMKWLIQQRNHMGGYSSTQDTVIGLQALSAYATMSSPELIRLTIRVTAAMAPVAHFSIDKNNYLQYQIQEIEAKDNLHIKVTASGRGFALFQLTTFYNTEAPELSKRRPSSYTHEAFGLYINVMDNDTYNVNIRINFWLREDQALSQTGMAILEVGLLSGFGLAQRGIPLNDLVRRVETSPGKVILYLDSVTTSEASVLIPTTLEFKMTYLEEAVVALYDYYDPQRKTVRAYMSETRQEMSFCIFCGEDCDRCSYETLPMQDTLQSAHHLQRVPRSAVLLLLLALVLCC